MVLDLLTSVLLWMEGVHAIGYAINDLKNGNLMMNPARAAEGIDWIVRARAFAQDKVTDSCSWGVGDLLLFNAPSGNRGRNVPGRRSSRVKRGCALGSRRLGRSAMSSS